MWPNENAPAGENSLAGVHPWTQGSCCGADAAIGAAGAWVKPELHSPIVLWDGRVFFAQLSKM
jgi:hypothetical protein